MEKKKMKVVQCWDDGVITDIRLTQLCRKYGAKATFNLNPGLMGDERGKSFWRTPGIHAWSFNGFCCGKLAKKDIAEIYQGFEVASHCWKHENADSLPAEEWIIRAVEARKFLEDIVQKPCTGFAWPCGRTTPETVKALRDAGFAYGRTTKNSQQITMCEDTMLLPSNCHFQNGQFYELYEKAKEAGEEVFYFWGHSYEMYEYDKLWEQYEMKLKYITEDPDSQWANVLDIIPLCKGK